MLMEGEDVVIEKEIDGMAMEEDVDIVAIKKCQIEVF